MTLTPAWRTRIFTAAAAVLAVWLSYGLAQERFVLPVICSVGLALLVVARLQPLPLGALLLSALTFGYIVGNRGFAQVTFSSRLPLFPAETVLLVGSALVWVQCAWQRRLPFNRDALNVALVAWILLGALRIGFDVTRFGAMALRDFALVYYAVFFFLGQEMGRVERHRRLFGNVLMFSCAALAPLYFMYERLPGFFFETLTWRGTPLIYYKGDLAGTFMAVGSVLFYLRHEERGGWWRAGVSLALAAAVLMTNNRASMLALFVATAWLAVRGRWRFAMAQATGGIIAVVVVLAAISIMRISWEKTPIFGIYERSISIFDPMGKRTYRAADSFNKGDNNLYRMVWWNAVVAETLDGNPYLGLGFGRDLANRFLREYYPEANDEFTVRSPHNVLLSIFARMGAAGLISFAVVLGLVALKTWRAVRDGPRAAAPWCAVWTIFTTACLGVVLEGPMGAVVFWTTLGIANAAGIEDTAEVPSAAGTETAPVVAPRLPISPAHDELAPTS